MKRKMGKDQKFSEINRVVEQYLDGIHYGDPKKLQAAMHDDCRMITVSSGDYLNISMEDYFEIVRSRASPFVSGENNIDCVTNISFLNSDVATVNLECLVLGKFCKDALTLIKNDGHWKIISKVYSYT